VPAPVVVAFARLDVASIAPSVLLEPGAAQPASNVVYGTATRFCSAQIFSQQLVFD
jgi:hypothetical protein